MFYHLHNRIFFVVCLFFWVGISHSQRSPPALSELAVEPFQIFDNFYFVGTGDVGSYVIKTDSGLILIDTLFGMEYVGYLVENMRKLGLDISDTKYVLILQGHWDHYGGARELQDEYTSAVFGAAEEDWIMIESDLGDRAPQRDLIIKDGDTLTLGELTIHFKHTPGHTPGTISMRFPVFDNGRRHEAHFHGGSALRSDDPEVARRFLADFERIKEIPGIEVQISNHARIHAQGVDNIFERAERLAARQPGDPHPWIAPDEFQAWLDEKILATRDWLQQAR